MTLEECGNSDAHQSLSDRPTTDRTSPIAPNNPAEPVKEAMITTSQDETEEDFNPSNTQDPYSPFYLYNHDSPRPSTEHFKHKSSIQVCVQRFDLEKGLPSTLSHSTAAPGVSKDKSPNKGSYWNTIPWPRSSQPSCMTKPKPKWGASLSKKQRMVVKLVIAVLVAGALIGTIVGVAVKTHSGVYKNQNSQTSIG